MLINILLAWSIIELINWINYIFIYLNLLKTTTININEKKIDNIIEEIKDCTKNEIENLIRVSIIYNKDNLVIKNDTSLQINDLSLFEINYIIEKNILCNKKLDKIDEVRELIETKLNIKFNNVNQNRYIINEWGNLFFYFSFYPIFIILIKKLIFTLINSYMIYYLKFKYKILEGNNIGFLYNNYDSNKKTIFFIHGFGFSYIPYINILLKLEAKYNLVIVILPNISSYLYSTDIKLDIKKIVNYIYDFIELNNYKKFSILSHSFGTLISYNMIKDKRSKIVEKNISVDPIYFYRFHYKSQRHIQFPCYEKNNIIMYLFDNFINYLIYDSIYLKCICYRHLLCPTYWIYFNKNYNYNKFIFIFHKNDYVIDSELLYEQLKNKAKTYILDSDDSTHGTILFNETKFEQLFNILKIE
jgi:hypothetical protein